MIQNKRGYSAGFLNASAYAFLSAPILFPFVPQILDRDLQPFFLIALMVWVVASIGTLRISKDAFWALVFALCVVIYRLRFDYDVVDQARGLVFYITPIVMWLYLSNQTPANRRLFIQLIRASLYLYVLYAVFQRFGFDFLGRYDTDRIASGRGANSFCPEPSMFGFVITCLAIFLAVNKEMRRKDLIVYFIGLLMCGAASVILASAPFMFAAVLRVYRESTYKSLFLVAIVLAAFLSFLFPTVFFPPRLLELATFTGGLADLSDFSVLERAGHIYFIIFNINPLIGGVEEWGLAYSGFIATHEVFNFGSDVNNILSSIGATVYDGGFLGLIFLRFLYGLARPRGGFEICSLLSVSLMAVQSMPFSVPLLWIAAFAMSARGVCRA